MNTMLKAVCVVVLLICIGAIVWSVINAIRTSKRNKESEERNRVIFMSQINQMKNENPSTSDKVVHTSSMVHPQIVPKVPVNYEQPNEPEPEVDISGLKMKDFYGPNSGSGK